MYQLCWNNYSKIIRKEIAEKMFVTLISEDQDRHFKGAFFREVFDLSHKGFYWRSSPKIHSFSLSHPSPVRAIRAQGVESNFLSLVLTKGLVEQSQRRNLNN